jgi:PAS domain S-box-containing protein
MSELDKSRLLELLAQQSNDHAFIFLDVQGRVSWWSPGAENIFQKTAEEMLGKDLSQLFTPEDLQNGIPAQELEMARASGKAEDDRWHRRGDGSSFWASGMLVSLRSAEGNLIGFGKIVRNRTDIKEQLLALHNQVEALAAANRQLFSSVARLSHELRNPLALLTQALELLKIPASGNADFAIESMQSEVEFMGRLVDDLLEIVRLNTGKVRLDRRLVAMRDLVEKAVQSARAPMTERSHDVQVILPAEAIKIEADAGRIHQVLVNLLTNAAKFTPDGGRITVKGTTEGDEAVITVEDNGIGIPPEMLNRIFELFTQLETATAAGGLGIGLSVVKELTALHGGSVQVRSEGPGKGSQFAVRLPLKAKESSAAAGS